MCAYQGVRNVSFLENLVYVLNGWPLKIHYGPIRLQAKTFSRHFAMF